MRPVSASISISATWQPLGKVKTSQRWVARCARPGATSSPGDWYEACATSSRLISCPVPATRKHAGLIVDGIDTGLQQPRRQPPRILDQAFGRHQQRGAALMHRARAAMAAAAVEIVGVALMESKSIQRQAERVGRDLGVGGFMALAIGMGADLDVDQAVLSDAGFGHFVGLAARGFEEAGIAETAQAGLRAREFFWRAFKSFRRGHRVIDRVRKAAPLERQPHRAGVGETG